MTMTAAFPSAAYNIRPSRGTGPDASTVEHRVAEVGSRLAATETFGRLLLRLATDLDPQRIEGGEFATPHPRSVQYAERFLRRLPYKVTPPEIEVDNDGEVAFEWTLDAGRLSLTFTPDGRINYSGLFADGETYGAERFNDEIPESILRCLRRVMS